MVGCGFVVCRVVVDGGMKGLGVEERWRGLNGEGK